MHKPFSFHYIVCYILTLLLCSPVPLQAAPKAVPIITGLHHPWSMVFLPNGEILISERQGRLRRVQNGKLRPESVSGLPSIRQVGQGGLMGLALHPKFPQNQWLYFSYAGQGQQGYSTHMARARYKNGQLTDLQPLFEATPKNNRAQHFGGRILFDKQGYLYLTLGDRGERDNAQNITNHAGTVIRLHDDGRIPANNPFVNQPSAMPEIFSYGHRNQQGAAIHLQTGELWTHEHGPQGGDELNRIQSGANYGWPTVTYGEEYGGGKVGAGKHQQIGIQSPVYYWTPSIAPSGMTFVTSPKYPEWQGDLLIGALKFQLLAHLSLKGNTVTREQRYLTKQIGRIRDVQQAPDGFIYILTDESNGGLYRLKP